MELATIDVDQETARRQLSAYRSLLVTERRREDIEIIRGYEAIKRGHSLIELTKTVAAGGFDGAGRPRIAVAGATWEHVWVSRPWRTGDAHLIFSSDGSWRANAGALVNEKSVNVRAPGPTLQRVARAIVPTIPPAIRPRRSRLHLYHVLFEAEWQPVAPRDPALLRHVGGDLWAVYGVWELTELERAVLGRRA